MPTLLLESLRLSVSINSVRGYIFSKNLFFNLCPIKVCSICFNNPFRIYDASIFNIMIFFMAKRGLSLTYFIIFLKAAFILESTLLIQREISMPTFIQEPMSIRDLRVFGQGIFCLQA